VAAALQPQQPQTAQLFAHQIKILIGKYKAALMDVVL
jgi:hypothetical protein